MINSRKLVRIGLSSGWFARIIAIMHNAGHANGIWPPIVMMVVFLFLWLMLVVKMRKDRRLFQERINVLLPCVAVDPVPYYSWLGRSLGWWKKPACLKGVFNGRPFVICETAHGFGRTKYYTTDLQFALSHETVFDFEFFNRGFLNLNSLLLRGKFKLGLAEFDRHFRVRGTNRALVKAVLSTPELTRSIVDIWTGCKAKGTVKVNRRFLTFEQSQGVSGVKKADRIRSMAELCCILADAVEAASESVRNG